MISVVNRDNEAQFLGFLLQNKGVLSTKITSLYKAYKNLNHIAQFYLHKNFVICVFNNIANVVSDSNYMLSDLVMFLIFNNTITSVVVTEKLGERLSKVFTSSVIEKNNVLSYSSNDCLATNSPVITDVDLKQFYDVMVACFSNLDNLSYQQWLEDVTLRAKLDMTLLCAVECDSQYASVAGVFALDDSFGIINSVCTLKAYQHNGFASTLVRHLLHRLSLTGKSCYLICKDDVKSFYEAIGFEYIELVYQIHIK